MLEKYDYRIIDKLSNNTIRLSYNFILQFYFTIVGMNGAINQCLIYLIVSNVLNAVYRKNNYSKNIRLQMCTHAHTHIHMYVCACVCVCVCI